MSVVSTLMVFIGCMRLFGESGMRGDRLGFQLRGVTSMEMGCLSLWG